MIAGTLTMAARFSGDRRGVSAIEFALIAPLLVLTYFGMAELTDAMTVQRRVGHAASSVGDLAAQAETLNDTGVADVFAAASKIVAPYPTAALKLRVTSVTGNANGQPRVDWSDDWGAAPKLTRYNHCDVVAGLPAGLVTAKDETVIIAEAVYTYDTVVGHIMPNGMRLSDKFYLRPRKGVTVKRSGAPTTACDN